MSKDAYFFSHDTNARHDPKISALKSDYGIEGYGRYWIIVEMLAEQKDYELTLNGWGIRAIATECQTDKDAIKKFIQDCINEYELFKNNDKHFWSESLKKRMKYKDKLREKKREAGKKGAKVRWNKDKDKAEEKQSYSNANGSAIAKNGKRNETKKNKTKETKKNEIKENEQLILDIFQKIDNYPFDFDKDLEFIRGLVEDYPDADLLKQAKRWKIYKLDNPLKENQNPRSQFHYWIKHRKKYQNDTNTKKDNEKKIEERKKKQLERVNKYG